MPIKPENKHRYPDNWDEVRAAILERAGDCCEWCRVANHSYRNEYDGVTTDPMLADSWSLVDGLKVSRIVLTIAHVHDADPAACDDANLAALCQRCHNRHDAPMRAMHAYATRRAGRAVADLFPEGA
ncbi:hypothetical protein NYO91_07245 [Arhodomonas aquaeolei]|uniref:HNH endonuclease n=1 Tax=Arhodomonas aquaeolei TaxID=2369 RepID=UPI002166E0CD|nr:hypothetical protein [Arhodomonas aquaeolei]MCS4503871.1 hypothetical protein [Arhodomonas aquaeolei]